MRNFIGVLLAVFVLSVSMVEAVNKVYTLNSLPCGIVVDSEEWKCNKDKFLGVAHEDCIVGQAINLPMSFEFLVRNTFCNYNRNLPPFGFDKNSLISSTTTFLLNYSLKTDTVFSDIHIEDSYNVSYAHIGYTYSIIEGAYFDNTSWGYFSLYIIGSGSGFYLMLVKIQGDSLDSETRKLSFEKTFDLITPFISFR